MQRGSGNRATNLIRKSAAAPVNAGSARAPDARQGDEIAFGHMRKSGAKTNTATTNSQKRQLLLTGPQSMTNEAPGMNHIRRGNQGEDGGSTNSLSVHLTNISVDQATIVPTQQLYQQHHQSFSGSSSGRPPISPTSRSPHRLPSQDRHKVPPQELMYSSQNDLRPSEQVNARQKHQHVSTAGHETGTAQREAHQRTGAGGRTGAHVPDKRVSVQDRDTPGISSIDDLTIDIADLHRDVKAQKASFIESSSARVSEDKKTQHGANGFQNNQQHKRQGSSTVHLQLDIEHGTIRQQPTERSKPQIQEAWTNQKVPLSPKTLTKADVERQTQANHRGQHQSRRTTVAPMTAAMRSSTRDQAAEESSSVKRYSSSIDKTELQIAMPNNSTTVTIQTQLQNFQSSHLSPSYQEEMHQAQPYEIARHQALNHDASSKMQPHKNHPYHFPNQNEKRQKAKEPPAFIDKDAGKQPSATGSVRSHARGPQSSNQHKQMQQHQQQQQLQWSSSRNTVAQAQNQAQNSLNIRSGSVISSSNNATQHGHGQGEPKSIARQMQHQAHQRQKNSALARSQTSTNSIGRASLSRVGKKSAQATRTRSIHQQVAEVIDIDRRLGSVFDQKLKDQEQRFMLLLEKVVESNEVVKKQMQREIDRLQTQVNRLEEQLDSILPLATLGELHQQTQHKQSTQTENTEIRDGVQNLQCLQTEDDMYDEVLPLSSEPQLQRKIPQKPHGVPDLILNADNNYMLIQGATACSPISQLEGIDFGKVLSTRGDKTFINELTSGRKTGLKMPQQHLMQQLQAESYHQNQHRSSNIVSPIMQKLNLSRLSSSPETVRNQDSRNLDKIMSKREQEFIQRLNKLKQDDNMRVTSHRLGSLNEISEQFVKEPPKFIDHIDKQMSVISRNSRVLAQSGSAPVHLDRGNQGDSRENAATQMGQMANGGSNTGRSENVEDTHRSSMVDQRHLEQKSLRAVSRGPLDDECDDEADGQLRGEDLINDDLNAASNEQRQYFHQHDTSKQKYQSIRNKRTNSLHQSRDNSFLSTYNASLIGMNTSMHNLGQQPPGGYRNVVQANTMYGNGSIGPVGSGSAMARGYMTSPTAELVQSQRQGDGFHSQQYKIPTGASQQQKTATEDSVRAGRNQMMIIMNDDEDEDSNGRIITRQIISPMSRSGFQNYFGQDQAVSLTNCQDKLEPRQSHIVQEEEHRGDANSRVTNKINSRSASFHFSMNAGDGGTEAVKGASCGQAAATHAQDNLILDWGSPSQVKTVRQTHTSIVQQSRRVDLSRSLEPPAKNSDNHMLYAGQASHQFPATGFSNPLNSQKCTCTRPNLIYGPNQSLFQGSANPNSQPQQQLNSSETVSKADARGLSYQSAKASLMAHDRSVQENSIDALPGQNSRRQAEREKDQGTGRGAGTTSRAVDTVDGGEPLHNLVSHDRLDSARNDYPIVINTQTEGALETVADEDAPLKDTNNGQSVNGAGIMQSQLNQEMMMSQDNMKLTEVDQVMPSLPPTGFRSNPLPQQAVLAQQHTMQGGYEGLLAVAQPCGEWCHWLTGEAQREIIRSILTSTQGNTVLKASNGRPGDKRFLVNSVWWRKWCDYVNFDLVEVEQPSSQQAHLKRQRLNSHSASRHRQYSAKKSNTIAEESSFYSGSDSQKNNQNIKAEALSNNQSQLCQDDKLGDGGRPGTNGAASQNSSSNAPGKTETAAKRQPPHAVPKGNFMDELMSLKKQSKSIGRSQLQVNLDYSTGDHSSNAPSKLTNQSKASVGCRSGVRSPIGGADALGQNEIANTLEDDVDETKRGEDEDQCSLARMVPSIKNSGVTMRTSNNLNLYSRPGPVENHDLLQKRNCLLLKNNLIEHHNYVALPPLIWKHIYSWYSADWSIVRFLRRDTAQGVILDLYPLHEGMDRRETTHCDTDGEGALATVQ